MSSEFISGRLLESKVEALRELDVQLRRSFAESFLASAGERLSCDHIVYRPVLQPGMEISVIAHGEGGTSASYSVQVEAGIGDSDFGIPFVGEGLSLAEVLELIQRTCRSA